MKTTEVEQRSRVHLLAINALVAALYLALFLVAPSSGAIQFRISESLNHLVVFNKRLRWGVMIGVILANFMFGLGILDILFGGGQTILALTITAFLSKFIKNKKWLLFWNSIIFVATMFLIAILLVITAQLPFWATYGTLALSEAIIMALSAPVMYWIDKKLHFATWL